MLRWKLSYREMQSHRGRAVLTIASIMIGVAAVVAISLANGAVRRSYQAMNQAVAGHTALEVTAAGGVAFDQAYLSTVEKTPGVKAAVAVIQRPTIMYFGDHRRVKLLALGIDPSRDDAVREYELSDGQLFHEGKGVALNESFARSLGLKVGDPVKLLTPGGMVKTTVAGLLRPKTGAAVSHGATLFMPLDDAQRRFRAPRKVDRIQIVLADRADQQQVLDRLATQLPAGLLVHRPASHSSLADETSFSLEQGMKLATWFALLSAVFIITNTFMMNVGQRRKQLAIMRAVGATRRQVVGLIYREALLMALVGSTLGILLGILGAQWLSQAMARLLETQLPGVAISVWPLVAAVAVGVGISLASAYLPARQASHMSPQEAITVAATSDVEAVPPIVSRLGVIALAISIALLVASLVGWLPSYDYVFGSVVVLLCMVTVIPLVLEPASSLAASILGRWSRVEVRLAREQLLRHRGRTTLTIGVLFIALSTGLGLANSIIDSVGDVRHWRDVAIVGDYFVRASMLDMETGLSAAVPDAVGEQIRQIPNITRLDTMRIVSATVLTPNNAEGQSALVVARGYPTDEATSFDIKDFNAGQLRQRLLDGEVIVGSVLAQRLGLQAGGDLRLATKSGAKPLRIAAVSDDYLAGGLTIHMQMQTAQRLLGVEGVDVFIVNADRDKTNAVAAALQNLCDEQGLVLQSFADIGRQIDGMMAGVVGSLWVLLVLGLVVAAFGVANTLGMNVLEQTRELAMLRVVGTTRRQIHKTIVAQAVILGAIGLLPATVMSVVLAYTLNLSTLPDTGHSIAFEFHPALWLGGLLVAMMLVVAAAWLPAARAARLQPAEAMRYE